MKKVIVIGVYLLSLALLLSLGAWQLQRGQHKAQLEQQFSVGLKQPIAISGLQFDHLNSYERVRIEGYLLAEKSFLLQNRVYQGEVGVEVLTPFKPLEGEVFIVNRGWINAEAAKYLSLHSIADEVEVIGTVYKPNKGVTIGEAITEKDVWPVKSLYLDLPAFTRVLKQPVAKKILVLEESHPLSFKKIWLPVTLSSTKHYGYAVQWFGLAITFIIFGYIWFRRRV